jgi:general secretion pathway protein L
MQRELDRCAATPAPCPPTTSRPCWPLSAGIQGVQDAKSLQYQDKAAHLRPGPEPEALGDAQQSRGQWAISCNAKEQNWC